MCVRKSWILAVLASLPLALGCSDDPSPTPFGPDTGESASTNDPQSASHGTAKDAGAKDVQVDRDPGYRDPNKVDAACASPNMVCNGACVDVGNDNDSCGVCGNKCTGPGAHCTAGACGCTGPLFDYCTGQGCMDVSSDVSNCGKCGNVCDPNQFDSCVDGACVQSN
jgi:hypothetical protein